MIRTIACYLSMFWSCVAGLALPVTSGNIQGLCLAVLLAGISLSIALIISVQENPPETRWQRQARQRRARRYGRV